MERKRYTMEWRKNKETKGKRERLKGRDEKVAIEYRMEVSENLLTRKKLQTTNTNKTVMDTQAKRHIYPDT